MNAITVFADIKEGKLSFIITGKSESGNDIISPIGNRDLSDIKDHQDQWFLGLAWLCGAVPRAHFIKISDRTIVDIVNTVPVESAIKKVLGKRENFKIAMEFLDKKDVSFVDRKNNLAVTVETIIPQVIEPVVEKPIEPIVKVEPVADVKPVEEVNPKPVTPKVPKVHREK